MIQARHPRASADTHLTPYTSWPSQACHGPARRARSGAPLGLVYRVWRDRASYPSAGGFESVGCWRLVGVGVWGRGGGMAWDCLFCRRWVREVPWTHSSRTRDPQGHSWTRDSLSLSRKHDAAHATPEFVLPGIPLENSSHVPQPPPNTVNALLNGWPPRFPYQGITDISPPRLMQAAPRTTACATVVHTHTVLYISDKPPPSSVGTWSLAHARLQAAAAAGWK